MILEREQRASDLATKADRDISPKLTDEQYHALLYYTFKAGFKHPAQLLEAFVGDLSGWHRNGSDEEELAGEWFSRAYSGMGGSDSFLYYLYDHQVDIDELERIAVTFDHDPEEVYDEDPEEDYRETYGDIYPYDWYEDYLMDVRDEIDAVGRRRGAGLGGGHDEREQTLNQLLVEMDGFGVNQGVIVMAATNRPDILDPALLRPGRFDRQVVVGAPDAKGREEILQVHARGKKLAPDVDLKDIANTTQGFTGADLENLLNEAALHAARKNKKEISMQDVKDSFIRVALGTEKKSHIKTELERKITAYHEAGHAILFEKMPDLSPVHTVSIIPIGMAGGYTMPVPTEKSFRFKRSMEQEIVATFGGRVAEEMIFGDYTQGASKDIEQATNLARNMVTRFGMSEKMGPILYGEEDHEVFLGRDIGHSRNYGENVAGQIDSEIRRIIDEAYNKAKEVLEENRDGLERTAQLLLKKEKVSGDEFREVLNNETVEEPQETVVIDSEHFNAENSEN
mgnify:CR=1 FL=1